MDKREKKIVLILIISLILIDQLIKIIMIISNTQIVINDWLKIGFEQASDTSEKFTYILIAWIAVVLLYRYMKSNNSYVKLSNRIVVCFGIAGVISNVIDIIWKGQVISYIKIGDYVNFN